jgi:Alternative complex III, ActD subunit
MSPATGKVFGTVGEFPHAQATLAAARSLREAGFEHWDVFSPAPLEQLEELMPSRRGMHLTAVMVGAALIGAWIGYFVQWDTTVLDYPINVAGHPNNGWPGFIPSAWEICALFTVHAGFVAFLISCRLPRLYHPLFATPDFQRASQDRFFICVEAQDRRYDGQRLRELFREHGALAATEIAT